MANTLCISILFLDHRFHGKSHSDPEWPPSPWRLFQALVAADSRNGGNQTDVFEWLESLKPPKILAPKAINGKERTVYVPNNETPTKRIEKRKHIDKTFKPTLITGNSPRVDYLWEFDKSDEEKALRLIEISGKLTAVGWGIDLVAGSGKILNERQVKKLMADHAGDCWLQAFNKGISLRVARRGAYENLKSVYKSQLGRFEGNVYKPAQKPVCFDELCYIKKDLKYRPCACFKLLQPLQDETETPAHFAPQSTIDVSAWVRGLMCDTVKQKGFVEGFNSESYVAGHQSDKKAASNPRFSYLPLPSIGHKHADGLIRRLIISDPYQSDGLPIEWINKNLHREIIFNNQNKKMAELKLVRHNSDKVFGQYTKNSKDFCSVTPVVLPGFDDLNYKKSDKLFEKAIIQCGFDLSEVKSYTLKKAPFFPGAYHPREYKRVKHFERYSLIHAEISWYNELSGPLSIGAGRYRGLGLFAPPN